jgi:hypothetical protein
MALSPFWYPTAPAAGGAQGVGVPATAGFNAWSIWSSAVRPNVGGYIG